MTQIHIAPPTTVVSHDDLAFWYNRTIYFAGGLLLMVVLSMLLLMYSSSLSVQLLEASALMIDICKVGLAFAMAYCLYETAVRLFPEKSKVFIGILIVGSVFIPFLLLILLLSCSYRATMTLRKNGFAIGLLGAARK